MSESRYASDAITLGESTHRFESEGFTGQFAAVEDAEVLCFTCHRRSPASTVELDAMLRIEGASDPDDMVAVAAVSCPICQMRGTLILKYGASAPPDEADVLRDLEDRRQTRSGGTSTSSD